ncbi:serine aminopeptidase S33 family [Pseudonocardia sediminis]|uniref:Serine aminopeptidase S33 family n=1 Tax=Pseudonocardia sediminis TaxID=1397368 RepID=A0A4Q7UV45_PSEST|nr:alpha/beta fold hydrolase [Pseudonocardia sediminis]RZT85782.1 serine aminopeptidase S33 family [Pseudonocardia sediminis]
MTPCVHSAVWERRDVEFVSGADRCRGWLYLPAGRPRPPVVVLGHGAGGTREMGLDAYAERFAAAGLAVLAFTYRYFGDSGGEPRQMLSVRRQLEDWDAALAFVTTLSEVDGTCPAIWGSSLGGGHVLRVAARHREVRAVVSQCPFTDGVASALGLGPGTLRLLPAVARDVVAGLLGRPPVTVPLAGTPDSPGLMSTPDALPGYLALAPREGGFVNAVLARALPQLVIYRPGRGARSVAAPLLVCISETDSVAPPRATLRHVRRAPHVELHHDRAGHFDFYLGEAFERLVARQTDFLVRHLAVPA